MSAKEMIVSTAKNPKPSFPKKWKQSEWLHGKECSVTDISSLTLAFSNVGTQL